MSPELKIKWEWESGESARAREHAATWARIEIWAGAECVTLVEDIESGSSRRSIYCPLYPLAEWIAYNWWALQANARPARELGFRLSNLAGDRHEHPSRLHRHSIRASGDGFLWPNLFIIPEGRQTQIVWRRDGRVQAGRSVRFLTQGEMLVDRDAITRELALVVSKVLNRLVEQGVENTPLQKEWDAITQTTSDEQEYCLAASRLGLDPYSEAEAYEQSILNAADRLPRSLLGDFLDAVDPGHIDAALSWLDSVPSVIRSSGSGDQREALQDLRRQVWEHFSSNDAPPWEIGWRQAKDVRRLLEIEDSQLFALDEYISDKQRRLEDRGLLAAGASIEEFNPVVVFGQSRARTSHRFTMARALWNYLWGEEGAQFVVTTAYTDRQKVERAFAAELLAPARGIAALLDVDPEAALPEDLEHIAQSYEVSSAVIQHQWENQLLSV